MNNPSNPSQREEHGPFTAYALQTGALPTHTTPRTMTASASSSVSTSPSFHTLNNATNSVQTHDRNYRNLNVGMGLHLAFIVRSDRGALFEAPIGIADMVGVLRRILRRRGWGEERIAQAVEVSFTEFWCCRGG